MPKVTDLTQVHAKVTNFESAPVNRTEKVLKTLGTVGLVAGTIAAGCLAARVHLNGNKGK